MQPLVENTLKSLFALALLAAVVLYFIKDRMPPPSFYDSAGLAEPAQHPTASRAFIARANGREYLITPRFDYALEGVVVSYHDADAFTDIWHHERWQDYLNLRDLCVIWGQNVESGVYRQMDFHNDSWSCWASWPDRELGRRFSMKQLSNNHLLIDDPAIRQKLLRAEPGDHVSLRGMLAEYSNPDSGFFRGTSTTRDDTGNGACETIYVTDFDIVKKANPGLRDLYAISKWLAGLALTGMLLMFFLAPYRGRYARDA